MPEEIVFVEYTSDCDLKEFCEIYKEELLSERSVDTNMKSSNITDINVGFTRQEDRLRLVVEFEGIDGYIIVSSLAASVMQIIDDRIYANMTLSGRLSIFFFRQGKMDVSIILPGQSAAGEFISAGTKDDLYRGVYNEVVKAVNLVLLKFSGDVKR